MHYELCIILYLCKQIIYIHRNNETSKTNHDVAVPHIDGICKERRLGHN